MTITWSVICSVDYLRKDLGETSYSILMARFLVSFVSVQYFGNVGFSLDLTELGQINYISYFYSSCWPYINSFLSFLVDERFLQRVDFPVNATP